ncbi:aspartate/glutamate racemase family protein [Propionispora vibrioides]|uniref:Allantoin racemase n=1 Tax=Propionispora vibrioides TaxID=112903 RepID=A0A1H8TVU6_9FIRM|nr:aspartate/glutamate racemase family protein [Propionispora vibrioides]SEO95160.1 allantoin racemase [Propionispora vibrioides]
MKRPNLLVINPNSSPVMTGDIEATVQVLSDRLHFDFVVTSTPGAPDVLESFRDYTLGGASVLQRLAKQPPDHFDGLLLACFGDPALYALKEQVLLPVTGIAEASFSLALLLGYRFGILAASAKAKPMMESLVLSYGLQARLAGVAALEVPIGDFAGRPGSQEDLMVEKCESLRQAGAEVIILGCAGMTGIGARLQQRTGLTVIDPVVAGCTALWQMIAGGFCPSRTGLYA